MITCGIYFTWVAGWQEGTSWGQRVTWLFLIVAEKGRLMISALQNNSSTQISVTFCKGLKNIEKRLQCKFLNFILFAIFCPLVTISGPSLEEKDPRPHGVTAKKWAGQGGNAQQLLKGKKRGPRYWQGSGCQLGLRSDHLAGQDSSPHTAPRTHLCIPALASARTSSCLKCLTFSLPTLSCNTFLLNAYECHMPWTQSKSEMKVWTVIPMVWYFTAFPFGIKD